MDTIAWKHYFHSRDSFPERWEKMGRAVMATWDGEKALVCEIRPAKSKRTLDQNALFWKWMETLSAHFSQKGHRLSKEEAHDLMCHKFLGYEEKTIGRDTVVTKLITTSKLSVGEFTHLLEQIDAWAADHGCLLPTSAEYAHQEYMRRQSR